MNKAPLVFLHGVTRRGLSALPLLPTLTPLYEVHMPDFPGHGASARRLERYLVADQVDAAEALLPERPCVVYGHSMGAMVAAALAAQHPKRVTAAILEDPPFDTMGKRIGETALLDYFRKQRPFAGDSRPVDEVARDLAGMRYGPKAARLGDERDAAALRFTARCLQLLDPNVLAPVVDGQWLDGYDRDGILEAIRCPVLLMQADPLCGGMLTDEDAGEVERRIADCARVRIANAGHLLHWHDTAATVRCVLSFLGSLE